MVSRANTVGSRFMSYHSVTRRTVRIR
jgi:hypothetical protein